MEEAFKSRYSFSSFLDHALSKGESPYDIVDILFAHRYGNDIEKRHIVIAALEATEDSRFVELADKIGKVHGYYSGDVSFNKKFDQAELLIKMIRDEAVDFPYLFLKGGTKITDSKGNKRTLKSELKYIGSRAKRTNRRSNALANKYKNVSRIDISYLYNRIMRFFNEHDVSKRHSWNDDWIRDGVIENRYEFISMLESLTQLQFMKKQSKGKIR